VGRQKIIGIDLGTTNSCVAALDDDGRSRILAWGSGERTIPSIVAFIDDGEVIVGQPARRQMVTNAANTVYGTKRLIGRKVNSSDVKDLARTAPFRVVAAPNGDAWIRIGNDSRSPQEIASYVLRDLKALAEECLGEPVTQAVVTVPAYFNDQQRQATKDAGTIAGLDVLRILNEPTAAALAYGAHKVKEGRRVIAVFDLGGGTFDVSVMAVEDSVFEVLATNGDSMLGGEDWDRAMTECLIDEVFDEHRVDLTNFPVALSRLHEACERAKRDLSSMEQTSIHLPFLVQTEGKDLHLERTITRDEVNRRTDFLLQRLRKPCEQALADAGLDKSQVEEVLLVGGMTRWPAVGKIVEEIFDRPPSRGANPDEVVALGASAHAGILEGIEEEAVLLDVTPHSIGIKIGDSRVATVIPRNSMLPVRERKLFATTEDDQEFFKIEVYQGESESVSGNKKLGEIKMAGLPKGEAGSVKLELTITIDVESILKVQAHELLTGKQALVTIKPSGGLSEQDLMGIVRRRRQNTLGPEIA